MIKDSVSDQIVSIDESDDAVVGKSNVFHFLIMAGIIGYMFEKVFEEGIQLFCLAEIRIAGNDRVRTNAVGAEQCGVVKI